MATTNARERYLSESAKGQVTKIVGTFAAGQTGVAASCAGATTTDFVVKAASVGTAGNAYDFQFVNDGLAKAYVTLTSSSEGLVVSRKVGGTAGNGKIVHLSKSSTVVAGSEEVSEDASTNLHVIFAAASTVTQIKDRIVAASTSWTSASTGTGTFANSVSSAGALTGTAHEYATPTSGPTKIVLHYVHGATTPALAKSVIEAASPLYSVTAGAATYLAAGDAGAKQDLSGGLEEIAPAISYGNNYSVAHTANTYTITLSNERVYNEILCLHPINIDQATPDKYQAIWSDCSLANKTFAISGIDPAAGAGEIPYVSTTKISFAISLVE